MKKFFFSFLVLLMTITAAFAQQSQVLMAWTFDGLPADTSANGPTPKVIPSNYSGVSGFPLGTIYFDGTHGASDWISATTGTQLNSFTGNVMNDPRTPTNASMALSTVNQTANGKSFVFVFSTTGYQNPVITFATRGTGTGFSSHTWEYSINGTAFNAITAANTAVTSGTWETKIVDLSAYDLVDDAAIVYVRLTVSGCTSGSGNNRFDNIVISAETVGGVDVTPPTLISHFVNDDTHIQLVFNEQLDPTIAQTATNYTFAEAVTVSSAALANNEVTLTLASPGLTEGNSYTLTIANIQDVAGNTMPNTPRVFTYGTAAQFQVATIADLRAKFTDVYPTYDPNTMNVSLPDVYKLNGNAIVTAINDSYRHQIYIQDATGAIVLDDNTNLISGVAEGDEITNVYGTLTSYYGHLQFVVTQNVVRTGAIFQEVTPAVVTLAQLDNNAYMNTIQSQLIKIKDVQFTATGNFDNNIYYTLQGGGTTLDSAVWIHIWGIPTLTGQAIPTGIKDVTGMAKTTRASFRIIPRRGSDIADPVGISTPSVGSNTIIYPNPMQDKLTVETAKNIEYVTILNLLGQQIKSYKMTGHQLEMNLSDLKSGVYFILLNGPSGTETSKIIKR